MWARTSSVWVCFVLGLFIGGESIFALNLIRGADEIHVALRRNGFIGGEPVTDFSSLKIAIIDNGFSGILRFKDDHIIRRYTLHGFEEMTADNERQYSDHGFSMAQILLAGMGAHNLPANRQPELHLINGYGLGNFKKAVQKCLDLKVDLVLHARNFSWGSDFKGGGFWTKVIEPVTQAGIVWINSVGNTAGTIFNGPKIRNSRDGEQRFLDFGEDEQNPRIPTNTLVFKNNRDGQQFRFYLTWNDFREDSEYATEKDLDLVLYKLSNPAEAKYENLLLDEADFAEGNNINTKQGLRIQEGLHRKEKSEEELQYTGHAFEQIDHRADSDSYYALRVINRSNNFEDSDRYRVRIFSENPDFKFFRASSTSQLLSPADSEHLIALGVPTEFSAFGPNDNGLVKPDLLFSTLNPFETLTHEGEQSQSLLPNYLIAPGLQRVQFSDTSVGLDTSTATALYTAVAAHLKIFDPTMDHAKLKSYLVRTTQTLHQMADSEYRGPEQWSEAYRQFDKTQVPFWYWPSDDLGAAR